jgi:hypothetical protein
VRAVEPVADRPDLPEGYLSSAPLPWAWAEQRLVHARNYWISTVAPHGAPRARPVWGVWLDGCVMFSTGARLGRDVRAEPRVCVHLDDADECVIVEGLASVTDDLQTRSAFIAAYDPKYEWQSSRETVDVVYVVRPQVAFGWLVHDLAPGATLFEATATRWRFPDASSG